MLNVILARSHMRILHLVSGIDPKSGGPTRSIIGLCKGLAQAGVETHLYVASPEHELANTLGVQFCKSRTGKLWHVWREVDYLIKAIKPDVIHLHGLWTPVNHLFYRLAARYNVPVVQSVRGMLDPWALRQKVLKKRVAFFIYQKRDLNKAACLHATADKERENIRAQGFKQKIVVVPNAVEIPDIMPKRSKRADGKKVILFLARMHPGKGMVELVEAWSKLRRSLDQCSVFSVQCSEGESMDSGGERIDNGVGKEQLKAYNLPLTEQQCSAASNNWHVEYAGPDCGGYLAVVQARIREMGLEGDFTYLGELDDEQKWEAYRRADLFVLPTHSENFGIVVAEALAAGVPVITTKGAPWSELMGSSDHECLNALVDRERCSGGFSADDAKESEKSRVPHPRQAEPAETTQRIFRGGEKEAYCNHGTGCNDEGKNMDRVRAGARGSQEEEPPLTTYGLQLTEQQVTAANNLPAGYASGRCGWWIEIGVEPLVEALLEAMSLTDEERAAMGENGRALVERRYRWEAVAEGMREAYARLICQ